MLRDTIAKFFKVDSLIGNLTGYVETRIELLKIEAREEFAKAIARIIVYLTLSFLAAVVIIFFSMGVAVWLSELVGGFAAFAIVAGFYLLLGVVLLMAKDALVEKMEGGISKQLNKKQNG